MPHEPRGGAGPGVVLSQRGPDPPPPGGGPASQHLFFHPVAPSWAVFIVWGEC